MASKTKRRKEAIQKQLQEQKKTHRSKRKTTVKEKDPESVASESIIQIDPTEKSCNTCYWHYRLKAFPSNKGAQIACNHCDELSNYKRVIAADRVEWMLEFIES